MSDNDRLFRSVGRTDDIERWPVAAYYLADLKRRIAVARVGDELYAFDDLCPRDNCSLASGLLKDDYQIMCQCAGCHFDIRTGAVILGPATEPLGTYEVREIGGELEVRV